MADRELIAAMLTAGMLPTLEIPRSRLEGRRRPLTRGEAEALQCAVDHALGLYRSVLNGLGVDPRSVAEANAQPHAPTDRTRNLDQRSHSHAEAGAPWEHTRSAFTEPSQRGGGLPCPQQKRNRAFAALLARRIFAGMSAGATPSALACSSEYDTSSDETALSEPQRGYLVSRAQSRDRLGLCQTPSKCPVRRSPDPYRNRSIPQRPAKSRTSRAPAVD
jgi:hypothetical protein